MFTLALLGPAAAQETVRRPVTMEAIGVLRGDGAVGESSGLAVSRAHHGILWTHNDSDGEPVLYAIREDGTVVTAIRLRGARAVDWESLALGPCPAEPADCLFVGDLGDNAERRPHGVIYYLPEPDAEALSRPDGIADARGVQVRYREGPRDVEAMAIDPAGRLHLITKGRSGPIERYVIPRHALRRDTLSVTAVETLPIAPQRMLGRLVTGTAYAPDGRRVVVRTYTELYFFDTSPDGRWRLIDRPCWLGLTEPQGEGTDFLDDDTVLLTSEANLLGDGSIMRVRC